MDKIRIYVLVKHPKYPIQIQIHIQIPITITIQATI